jgi:hypothetical protein
VIEGVAGAAAEAAAWDALLRTTLSDLGRVGEMYTSASPYDPAFWVLHGAVDRLVHWKRLVAAAAAAAVLVGCWRRARQNETKSRVSFGFFRRISAHAFLSVFILSI